MWTSIYFTFLSFFNQAFLENKAVEKVKKDPKRLSVERIYQKKTQLEHILLRPDSYIGSVEPVTQVNALIFIFLFVSAFIYVLESISLK